MQLSVRNVHKTYSNDLYVLRGINLELQNGVVGLLGSNGAGKTTLLKILSTNLAPSEGEVFLDGVNILKNKASARLIIGYLPQFFGVYNNLNSIEFLRYIGCLKGMDIRKAHKKIDELLEIVNLYEVRSRPLSTFSGGMKQRLGIAQALINDPKFIILDEPSVGLDPEERINFRNLLAKLSTNKLIIISTHIVSDVEAIATRIVIMNKGNIIKNSLPEQLLKEMDDLVWEVTVSSDLYESFRQQYIVSNVLLHNSGLKLKVISSSPPNETAIKTSANLEDAYLYYSNDERVKL